MDFKTTYSCLPVQSYRAKCAKEIDKNPMDLRNITILF